MSSRLQGQALASVLSLTLAATAAQAAPPTVSADLSAQAFHRTGKASLDAAVVVRRGSFFRAGVAFDATQECDNPGMMLRDVASGATLRMPLLGRNEGAALTRLNADALRMRAQQRCADGVEAACGHAGDWAGVGSTLFSATLQGQPFGASVAKSADGSYTLVSVPDGSTGKTGKGDAPPKEVSPRAIAQYAELVHAGGTPFYSVVIEHAVDTGSGQVHAALAVWLPEDLPIGAYTLSLGCGQETVGEGLPLVVLFNPYDATTDEVASKEVAATVQQGRPDVVDTPGIQTGFALEAPDQAAIDTLLELISAFPLAARRHPALVAQLAAKGRGPIQLTGRANYHKAGKASGYDGGFLGGETNAQVWKAISAWNDATGHFDLWDAAMLGEVGDGAWPFEGAARLRIGRGASEFQEEANAGVQPIKGKQYLSFQVAGKSYSSRLLHLIEDSFGKGHTLRAIPAGALTPVEALYSAVLDAVGSEEKAVGEAPKLGPTVDALLKTIASVDLSLPQDALAKGSKVKYGQCWVFSGLSATSAKGGGTKYGQCWVFASVLAAAKAASGSGQGWAFGATKGAALDAKSAFGEGLEAYALATFDGVQRSANGVVPRSKGGLWTWKSGDWADGAKGVGATKDPAVAYLGKGTFGVIGAWTFDGSAGQDGSTMAIVTPIRIEAVAHFIDDWQGETAYLKFDGGSGNTRVSATSSSGTTPDPLKGIIFHKGLTASYGVDDVKVETLFKTNPDQPTTISGTLLDTGSVFRAYRIGGRGQCHFGKCFCLPGLSEGLLRAAGIPTRSVTNLDSAHEKQGFEIPAGVAKSNGFLMRSSAKAGPGQPFFNFESYLASILGSGGSKDSVWNFHVWNELALKAFGESAWNFHVWTEALVPTGKEGKPSWNAYDSTPQEGSDSKLASAGAIWGLDCAPDHCAKDPAMLAAAVATGLPVDVLVEALFKPRNVPTELLHSRWDDKYKDGKEPSTWTGSAKPADNGASTAPAGAESAPPATEDAESPAAPVATEADASKL